MAGKPTILGPGRLTIGEVASAQEFGTLVTKCMIEPDVDEGDTEYVLSGDEYSEGDTETAKLTGEFFQDTDAGMQSLVVWCRTNTGKDFPFTFVPNNEHELEVVGTVTVRTVSVGGDVKKKNTSEFEWKVKSDWKFQTKTA